MEELEYMEQKPWHGHSKQELYMELKTAQNQLKNTETEIEKIKIDLEKNELKISQLETENENLNSELTYSKSILTQFVEDANVLEEEMQILEKMLKEAGTNVHLNWLQSYNGNFNDLLHTCRNCLSQLGHELIAIHSQMQQIKHELMNVRESKDHVDTLLEDSNRICKLTVKELELVAIEREEINSQIQDLTADNLKLQEQLSYHATLYNVEQHGFDSELLRISSERQDLFKRLTELENLSKKFQTQAEKERKQTELKTCEATKFEKKYWRETLEKNCIFQRLQVFQLENSSLLESQQALMSQIQRLRSRINVMNEENTAVNLQIMKNEDKIKSMENQIILDKHERGEIETKLLQFQINLERIEQERNCLCEEKVQLEGELKSEKETRGKILKDSNEQIQKLILDLQVSQKDASETEKKGKLIEAKLRNMENELKTSEEDLREAENGLKICLGELKEKEKYLEISQKKLLDSLKELELAQIKLKEKEEESDINQKGLLEKQKQLELIQEKFKQKDKELQDLKEDLSESKKVLELSEEKLKQQESSLQYILGLEEKLTMTQRKLEESKNSQIYAMNLEKQLQIAQEKLKENEYTHLHIMKLEKELEITKENWTKNKASEQRVLELEVELEKSLRKFDITQMHIMDLERELKKYQEMVNELEMVQKRCRECAKFQIHLTTQERLKEKNSCNMQLPELLGKLKILEQCVKDMDSCNNILQEKNLNQSHQLKLLEEELKETKSNLKNARENLLEYREHIKNMDISFAKLQGKIDEDHTKLYYKVQELKFTLLSANERGTNENLITNECLCNKDLTEELHKSLSECMILIQNIVDKTSNSQLNCIAECKKLGDFHICKTGTSCESQNWNICQREIYSTDYNTHNKFQTSDICEYVDEQRSTILKSEKGTRCRNCISDKISKSVEFENFNENCKCFDLEKCIAERDNLKCELENLKIKYRELEIQELDFNKIINELNDCKEVCNKITYELEKYKSECNKLTCKLQCYKEETESLNFEFENCKEKLEKCKVEHKKDKCKIECSTKECNRMLQELENSKSEYCKIISELKSCKADKNVMSQELESCKRNCSKKSLELEKCQTEYDKVKLELNNCMSDKNKLLLDFENCKRDYITKSYELDKSKAEQEKLNCELQCCKSECSKIYNELMDSKANKNKQECELEHLKQENNKLLCELDKSKAYCEAVISELDCLREDYMKMAAEFESSKADSKALTCEMKCLKQECNKIFCEVQNCRSDCHKVAYKLESCQIDQSCVFDNLDISKSKFSNYPSVTEDHKADCRNVAHHLQIFEQNFNKMMSELENCVLNHEVMIGELKNCAVDHNDVALKLLKIKRCWQQLVHEFQNLKLHKKQMEHQLIEVRKEKEILIKENNDISEKLLHSAHFIAKEKGLRQKAENKTNELLLSVYHLEMDNENEKQMMSKQCMNLKKKQKNLEKTLQCYKNRDAKMKQNVSFKKSVLKTTTSQLNKMEKRIENLKKELRMARERILNQQYSHGELEKQLKILQVEKEELSLQIEELKRNLHTEEMMRSNLEHTSKIRNDKILRLQQNAPVEEVLCLTDLSSSKHNREPNSRTKK